MQANPWISDMATLARIAQPSPSQADPVSAATAAATNAPESSLPSSEMSMTPDRSANIPAIAQKISGVAILSVASKVRRSW